MEEVRVCTPQLAESDAQNNTSSSPNAASVTDADKVINTQIDNTPVEGDKDEEELLEGLLTDDYCHVCEAVLLFESQRLSHYEGKKHAQRVKLYLQAKKAESTATQRTTTTNKDRFCGLCNMVFSSHLVANFHYEGKVHTKNLRKQGVQPPVMNRFTEVCTSPRSTQDPDGADQASVPEGRAEHLVDPAAAITTPSTVDLKDPNKCCALCTASFNNPQMALQHYNGRRHQRNQARQELIKELGDDVQQANFLMCQMCSVQFNSVEMYQAHVQGNKHQIREKKVVDLCKSQQKNYNTYADELADYIQVQKARGITTKTSPVLPQGDTQEDEEGVQEVLNKRNITGLKNQPHPSSYYPPNGGWRPPFHGPAWPPHSWDFNCPPPVLPGSGSGLPQFTSRPMKRSSSSSSCSISTSDSDDSEYKQRERRRIRRSEKERGKRTRDEDSDKEERRRKRQRKERDNEKTMRKREETVESEQERRRKKQKKQGKGGRKEKKSQEDDVEKEGGDMEMDNVQPEDMMDNRKYTEVHIQAEINVGEGECGPDESTKPKYRKEKKKMREKLDTRTEEEKLWDDSILGC
ncbi:zinc finger matrin-type protein 1 isoform X1 [Scophthalmus maximus]|uniref:zinc finger matrin-type protein 1 isoform X1 n=1 Tax=Scophthalmus maximus TaxID=52904 RepID=UPI0015E0CED2|nr:zinc finger matrin-type protein 1 isoform X1 [Scophthalmus maximus]